MSDQGERSDSAGDASDDIETGEPIEMLRELGEDPAPGFIARIRGALQRRLLASQLADLSWSTPFLVLLEYLKIIFGFFERPRREEGDSR